MTVVVRGDSMKLIGNERQIKSASNVFMQLLSCPKGNVITEQNVNYALSLAAEAKESAIVEIDKDCICHTINGKPVKPKDAWTEELCGCHPPEDDRLRNGTGRYR